MLDNNDKIIFDKITLYYDISDKIRSEILKLNDIDYSVKFDVLMPIVEKIKSTADVLMEKYIIFLKDKSNIVLKDEIIIELDSLLEYIYIYKNKLYDIYKNK
jgi:hypothetical protein